MPRKMKKPCAVVGCPCLTEGKYCEKHTAQMEEVNKNQYLSQNCGRAYEKRRKSANKRGYDSRWQRARRIFLSKNPLCAECLKNGRLTDAEVVDHIVPHKGDKILFWDEENWQSLCKRCHDRKTATEDGGFGNYKSRE